MESRSLAIWREHLIGAAGTIILILPALVWAGMQGPGIQGDRILIVTASVAVGTLWGFIFARRAFKRADEYQRERVKFAWHWGGMVGIMLSIPVYVFIGLGGLHWLDRSRPFGPEISVAFVSGYCLALFSQLLAFYAVAMWWRFAKR